MDSVLFEEWVRDVNKRFQAEGRKVTLIIENCPAHPTIENLSHKKLVFLPPNTTSVSLLIDQGIMSMSQGPLQETIGKVDTAQSQF